MFDEMLFADTLRGKDSTGVFGVNNLGNVGIVKDAVTAEAFLETPDYKKLRADLYREGWAVVGHNRKATRGEITDVNAHPFWEEDKLVLVHNGTYFGDHKKLADTVVDSHAIAIHLAKNIENYEAALREVNAAYALIFYDIENKKLQVIRNKDRPLFKVETTSCYYLASEPGILQWILHRHNETKVGKIEPLEELTLYTWELLGSNGYDTKEKKLDCSFRYSGTQAQNETWESDMCDWYGGRQWNRHQHNAYQQQFRHTPVHHVTPTTPLKPPEEDKSDPTIQLDNTLVYRNLFIPESNHPVFKYAEWVNEINTKTYPKDKKINVIVDDWVQPNTAVKEYYLTGKTLDPKEMPVVFKVNEQNLDSYLTTIVDDNLLFEVEVDFSFWKRRQDQTLPNTNFKLDELDGAVCIVGKNFKLIQQGTSNGQTH